MSDTTHDPVALFGLPMSSTTPGKLAAKIEEQILSGRTHQIVVASLDFLRLSLKDRYLHQIAGECSLLLAEGAPMRWAAAAAGLAGERDLDAGNLISAVAALSALRGHGVFVLGSDPQMTRCGIRALRRAHPGVRIAGHASHPSQPMHAMDNEGLLRVIEAAHPAVLLVTFGSPGEEIWIHRHRDRLKVPVSIGIGGVLEHMAGDSYPAASARTKGGGPGRIHHLRLFSHFALNILALLTQLPVAWAGRRLQRERLGGHDRKVEVFGTVRVISAPRRLSGRRACAWLKREARAATVAGQSMVVDLSATEIVEADGLECLLHARRILLAEHLWIWLTGMSNPVRRVLQFSSLSTLFRMASTNSVAIEATNASHLGVQRVHAEAGSPVSPAANAALIARAS